MDQAELLVNAVQSAAEEGRRIRVAGQGSKRFCLPEVGGEMLSVEEHSGIIEYEPAELVITARAGTPLRELERTVAREGQKLGAEPPEFNGLGTIGGAVASGFSGPGRPWLGSMRDCVLGLELVNGQGQRMQFGGQVMKNVAGYDVSRLNAGAFGGLGLILSVSLRLNPLSAHERTLGFEMDAQAALAFCRENARKPHPITATFWHEGRLLVRLSGTENALTVAQERLGGEEQDDVWRSIRDHRHEAFAQEPAGELVRLICPPNTPMDEIVPLAWEWGGGLRWFSADGFNHEAYADQHSGWAWQIGQPFKIERGQQILMQKILGAFDPNRTFLSPLNFELPDED